MTFHTYCRLDVELIVTEVIKSRIAKMHAKTVMYSSVYKYRLHPTYGPNLKSQGKWQLVYMIHFTGTEVQSAYRNRTLSMVFCHLLPNHCFLDSHKRNKIRIRLMLIALFSPPLIN